MRIGNRAFSPEWLTVLAGGYIGLVSVYLGVFEPAKVVAKPQLLAIGTGSMLFLVAVVYGMKLKQIRRLNNENQN